MVRITPKHVFLIKCIIHLVALSYLIVHYYWAFTDNLGADPVKAIIHFTGMGSINLLLITLCVSPVAKKYRQSNLMKTRRLLGLYTAFYALCHISNYLFFDLQFDWGNLLQDIIKRPYITVGFLSFVILVALSITSPSAIQRAMKRTWQKLHNYVYLSLVLGITHYLWSLKTLTTEPLIYLLMSCFLLFVRKDKITLLKRRVT